MTAAAVVASTSSRSWAARPTIDSIALAYIALPSILFVVGWLRLPWGIAGAVAIVVSLAGMRSEPDVRASIGWRGWACIVAVALAWCVCGGLGHFVYANRDWAVRDAVLVDLVRDRWPVVYTIDGVATLMRAPIGYFLPASVVGKVAGVRAAELALLGWTVLGIALVFGMMLRDRPSLRAASIRIGVFIAFSGMDIVGQIAHYNPHPVGEHLEWWAFLFQYSSQTTQLFWVPNHALPGWIAIAWLLGQDPRRLPVTPAVLFVVFAPLWSPLTAIGIAPIFGVALLRRLVTDRTWLGLRAYLDWRMLLPLIACVALVYPYLVAGTDKVASGDNVSMRWVGEDIVPRYIEFVLFEFVGFAVLLVRRDPRDPLLWAAICVLLALPTYRFGPANDLAMRASIPALALLAIRLGNWLSTPVTRDWRARVVAVILLAIGAVTPFMEFARTFVNPRWDMNDRASLIDVTRGTHYLTPIHQPWFDRFLSQPESR